MRVTVIPVLKELRVSLGKEVSACSNCDKKRYPHAPETERGERGPWCASVAAARGRFGAALLARRGFCISLNMSSSSTGTVVCRGDPRC